MIEMKKLYLPAVCFLFLSLLSCGQSGAKGDFSSLLSKVPVTGLPVGTENLEDISKIKIDWERRNAIDVGLACEEDDKYGLDGAFIFEDLDLVNYAAFLDYSLLPESSDMIFAKRLPPIAGNEFLIYFVTRTSNAQPEFPLWVLLMVDGDGVVLDSAVIAGADCKENDFVTNILFGIDADQVLTIKAFRSQDDEDGRYDPDYMYDFQTIRYRLSVDGIVDMGKE